MKVRDQEVTEDENLNPWHFFKNVFQWKKSISLFIFLRPHMATPTWDGSPPLILVPPLSACSLKYHFITQPDFFHSNSSGFAGAPLAEIFQLSKAFSPHVERSSLFAST